MKIFWFLVGVIVSTYSFSADTQGIFNCKIERQTVWSITDGEVKVFSGYSNSPKNGEYIEFRYGIRRDSIFFTNDQFFHQNIFLADAEKFGNRSKIVKSSNSFDAIQVGDSSIYAGSPVSQLWLERYYKSDWHGLLTSVDKQTGVPDLSQWTVAMTCRHVTDRIDQVMKTLAAMQE